MSQITAAINRFARRIAIYVATHPDYERWQPERVAIEAVTVVLTDPGAAAEAVSLMPPQAVLDLIPNDEIRRYWITHQLGDSPGSEAT